MTDSLADRVAEALHNNRAGWACGLIRDLWAAHPARYQGQDCYLELPQDSTPTLDGTEDQRAGAAATLASDGSENRSATGPTLVERLRATARGARLSGLTTIAIDCEEAADRIEALEQTNHAVCAANIVALEDERDRLRAELAEARKIPREPTQCMRKLGIPAMGIATNDHDAIVRGVWIAMYDAAMRAGRGLDNPKGKGLA